MRNAGLEEAQAGVKIADLTDMQMTPPLWQMHWKRASSLAEAGTAGYL